MASCPDVRRLIWPFALLLLPVVARAEAPVVAVPIAPLGSLIAELLPAGAPPPLVLLPAGRSPELYDPRPSDLASLRRAAVYLSLDLPFERAIAGSLGGHPPVAALQREAGYDAARLHVWLSPKRLPALVEAAATALARLPELHPGLDARRVALLAKVAALDRQVAAMLEPARGRAVLVWHPAWAALANDYGLREVAVEVDGKEPTAADLQRLTREVKARGIPVLLVLAGHLGGGPGAVAARLGIAVRELDPLAADWRGVILDSAAALAEGAR